MSDRDALEAAYAALRERFELPDGFPPEVEAAAAAAAARPFGRGSSAHVDRTGVEFVTLDPASSTDLDQAFAFDRTARGAWAPDRPDGDVVLRYAIADVGWFVRPGDPVDAEAWKRGVTVYLPDGRVGLHPPVLAEGAASLLPGVDRPAVVFTVRIAADGTPTLDGAERAFVRSRAKLAYSDVRDEDLPSELTELGRRVEAAEAARGAERVEFPEQEVHTAADGRFELRFRPRNVFEQRNAALSLSANIAVAEALHAAGTGLFRTMPEVDERRLGRLRHTAHAFGLDWPRSLSLGEFERSLDGDDPRAAAFLLAVRRAGGGAGYTPYSPGERPWHAAIKATYCHMTAPLRRLADRYVIEAALAVVANEAVPAEIEAAFDELPSAMARGDALANRADRAALDVTEAVVLRHRVGDDFDAVVTDEDDRGARIQIRDPAVVARVVARRVDPGDEVRVRLVGVDVAAGSVSFERIG